MRILATLLLSTAITFSLHVRADEELHDIPPPSDSDAITDAINDASGESGESAPAAPQPKADRKKPPRPERKAEPHPGGASGGPAVMVTSTYTCSIEGFLFRKGKSGTGMKKCDSLKDKTETQVKNPSECKDRAKVKGESCVKRAGADQIAVKGKVVEKLGLTSSTTSFSCEIDKFGGSACP
ncbi:MAG: hypothetical protein AB7F86_03080 [Bdellovibrionales bacterium]